MQISISWYIENEIVIAYSLHISFVTASQYITGVFQNNTLLVVKIE